MSKRVENERSKSRHLNKNELKNTKRDAFFLKIQAFLKVLWVAIPYGYLCFRTSNTAIPRWVVISNISFLENFRLINAK